MRLAEQIRWKFYKFKNGQKSSNCLSFLSFFSRHGEFRWEKMCFCFVILLQSNEETVSALKFLTLLWKKLIVLRLFSHFQGLLNWVFFSDIIGVQWRNKSFKLKSFFINTKKQKGKENFNLETTAQISKKQLYNILPF